MAKIGQRIIDKAFEILKANPEGLRFAEFARQIASHTSFNIRTIHGCIWNLDEQYPDRVYKPSRGLFRLTQYRDPDTDQLKEELLPKQPKKVKEEDFYGPFADWLVNEVEECTKAISLGGNRFRDKWGTPDVIGKRESKRSDIIKAPVEIVSAEVKVDATQLVTAFGQACAYCLFSATRPTWSYPIGHRMMRLPDSMRFHRCSASAWCSLIPRILRTHNSRFVSDRDNNNPICSTPIDI